MICQEIFSINPFKLLTSNIVLRKVKRIASSPFRVVGFCNQVREEFLLDKAWASCRSRFISLKSRKGGVVKSAKGSGLDDDSPFVKADRSD